MSTNDMPRVQKLKRNMSRAKSKDGVKDKSSSLICLIFAKDKLRFTVLSIPQYTRLNLETDSQEFAKRFSGTNYKMLSITPLSDAAFKAACANSDIDIISIDLSKYDPKKLWKEVKPAINRGLCVELLYSNFIMELPDGARVRQALFNAAKSVTFLLRGRNIIFSCGGLGPDFIRKPSDVVNIAQLLQIKNPNKIPNEIAKSILAKALARSTHAGITRTVGPKRHQETESDEDSDDLEIVIK